MAIYPDQLQPLSLAGSGAVAGATSIVLKSMKTIDGANVAMTDFGAIGYATIEPGSGTQEEQISFTGITQNSNGTATLSGVSSIGFGQPFTSTSGLSKTHAGSTTLVISNTSGFYNEIPFKRNNEALSGYWTCPDPVNNTEIANRQWVLSVVNGGAVSTSALTISGTAGETVAAGKVVYFKVSDGRWYLATSAAAATTDLLLLGVAQGAGTVGVGITGGVMLRGVDTHQSGLTQGTIYYLSTAGGISSSAGTVERAIGQAASTTSLNFDPYFYYTPTASQKAAFAGYRGTPSSTNTFLTSIALVSTPTDQSQTTQDTSSTIGEANATTKHNKLAQSFIPANARMRGVALYKSADTGSFTGTVTVSLQADSAGAPSGVSLASVVTSNAVWLALGTGPQDFIFSSEYTSLDTTATYWLVVSTSTSDNANHPNLGANSAGGYASGSVKYNNTTDGWVAVAAIDLYFKTYVGQVGSIPDGDSNGQIPAAMLPFTAPVVNVYTSNNTWTKPTAANFRYAIVEVLGAGGNGGAANGTNGNMGGGGGSGAYSRKLYAASALSATQAVVVGAVAAATSSFAGMSCTGGTTGTADTGVAGSGGTASGGDININGQSGGLGGPNGTTTSTGSGSAGGSSQLGRGGQVTPVGNGDANGQAGTGYGSGGAGGYRQTGNATGGAFAPGIVIVTEYYS